MRGQASDVRGAGVAKHHARVPRPGPLTSLVSSLILLTLTACAPPVRDVYVDVDYVLARDRPPKVKPVVVPTPPPAMPPTSVVQPGRPMESLRDPSRPTESDVR